MVRAWYMDSESNDQRLEHHRNPPEFITMDKLFENCGVEYFSLNAETYKTDGILDEIKRKRNYNYEDEIVCSKERLPNYEKTLKTFFTEHLHSDEEIRFVVDGSGYFDVRDRNDQWIRIEVVAGDMIVIPKGIYHRFTLDTKNYIIAKRLFCGNPVWTAFNRPTDDMECRKSYLEKLKTGFATS
ncbi:hypothetical protein RN001_005949 [Aquatica leii]|uniref:Acireductone dioxygenase n=1 Tax=Aquatica leii TaxID=1421715 RepID=A0AAN7SS58_9COLE|nr:hypothetical protein RN001_005949 [Aquatica leii]